MDPRAQRAAPRRRLRSGGRGVALLLLALILGLPGPALAAGVYKWVDENGKTHYGDRPPPGGGGTSVEVKPANPGSASGADEAGRAARQQRMLQSLEAARRERAEARAQEREALAKKQERRRKCTIAKQEGEQLRRAGAIYNYDAKGERRFLSDDERARFMRDYEAKLKKYCG